MSMIEPNVVQCYAVRRDLRGLHQATPFATSATHLEYVREIGAESDLDGEASRALIEIAHNQALEAGRVP